MSASAATHDVISELVTLSVPNSLVRQDNYLLVAMSCMGPVTHMIDGKIDPAATHAAATWFPSQVPDRPSGALVIYSMRVSLCDLTWLKTFKFYVDAYSH